MARAGAKFKSVGASVALDRKLQALNAEGFVAAKERCMLALENLIQEEFHTSTDPRGIAWAPRKPPAVSWPLLFKTANLFNSFLVHDDGARLRIENTARSEQGRPYGVFHQRGTIHMVPRKIVPDRYLSPKWRAELRRVTNEALLAAGAAVPSTGPRTTGGRGRR